MGEIQEEKITVRMFDSLFIFSPHPCKSLAFNLSEAVPLNYHIAKNLDRHLKNTLGDWVKDLRRHPEYHSPDPLTRERGICLENDCSVRKYFLELRECTKRVMSKSYTMETCHQETIDLIEALDRCMADKAFIKLS